MWPESQSTYNEVMRQATITMLLVFIVSSGASPQTNTKQRTPSASSLKVRIPPAKHNVYDVIRDGREWKNPYLIVSEDGIEVRKTGDDYTARIVPVAEVIDFLENLPKAAWPYGLIVAVQDNGICCRYSDGDARKRDNRLDLLGRLKREGIPVSLWPSA